MRGDKAPAWQLQMQVVGSAFCNFFPRPKLARHQLPVGQFLVLGEWVSSRLAAVPIGTGDTMTAKLLCTDSQNRSKRQKCGYPIFMLIATRVINFCRSAICVRFPFNSLQVAESFPCYLPQAVP
jgi:hypothetical protein